MAVKSKLECKLHFFKIEKHTLLSSLQEIKIF